MTFSVLELALPGREPSPAGVLLYDEEAQRLGVKMRRDWHKLGQSLGGEAGLEADDTLLLASVEGEIKRRAAQDGAAPTLHWLEDSLANVLRLTQRQAISGGKLGFEFTLHSLYKETMHSIVESVVRPFVTHLPVYALRSAAGPFRVEFDEGGASQALDWLEAPSHLRLSPGMFVAEVVGDSMLPLIPNGSLCVFRKFGAGSRNNRKVLVEDRSTSGIGGAGYTVKIYHSEKSASAENSGDGQWSQNRIWLESINPAFPPIELNEEDGRYAVVAEFVSVLEA